MGGLRFVPAGVSSNGRSAAESPHMAKVLANLQQEADLLVIDAPPLLASPGGMKLAAVVDGVVLLVPRGTTGQQMRETRRLLTLAKVPLVGYVFDPSRASSRRRTGDSPGTASEEPGPSPPDIMRILQLHTRYRQRGGEDRVVAAQAQLLRSGGHEVEQLRRGESRSHRCARPRQLGSRLPIILPGRASVDAAVARLSAGCCPRPQHVVRHVAIRRGTGCASRRRANGHDGPQLPADVPQRHVPSRRSAL